MISSLLALLCFLPSSTPVSYPAADPAHAQDAAPPQAKAVSDLLTELRALAKQYPKLLQVEEWGRSHKNRPLLVARVAFAGKVPAEHRPALLLVAGLDGRRLDDSRIAMEQLRRILKAEPESETARRLAKSTLFVAALANPDGLALDIAGNGAPYDDDRDGREGEDGPDDINGDGRILQMRWKDAEGNQIEDPDHPGLMRKADPQKNERGVYRVEPEGKDADDDQRYNEDAAGGVLLERNFAQLYPEHQAGAGRYVLSEPASLSLAQFVSKHPRVMLVLSYGNTDNLLAKPKKNSRTGRREPLGNFEQDLWIYDELGKIYRDKTGREGKNRDVWPGRFHSWVYAHMGIPCLSTSLVHWSDKDKPTAKPTESDSDKQADAKTEQPTSQPATAKQEAKPSAKPSASTKNEPSDESKMRTWLQKHYGDDAFTPWKAAKLPDGKEVEVGGLSTALLMRIPPSQKESITASHLDYLLSLLDRMPDVQLGKVTSKQLAPGVIQVQALVSNEGWLPPRIHIASLLRRSTLPRLEAVIATGAGWRPILPAQQAPKGATALLTGPRLTLLSGLRGLGSHSQMSWTFRIGKEGTPLLLLRVGDHVLGSSPVPRLAGKNGGGR